MELWRVITYGQRRPHLGHSPFPNVGYTAPMGASLVDLFLASQAAGSVRAFYHAQTSAEYAAGVWIDRSGNGNDTAQATGTKQPAYEATALNGRGALSFDGGDCLQVALDLSAYTWVACMALFQDTDADGSGYKVVVEHGANPISGPGFALVTNDNSGAVEWVHRTDVGTSYARAANSSTPMSSPGVVTGYGDVTLATNEAEIRHNITNVTASRPVNSNNTGNFASLTLNIGARNNAAGNAKTMSLAALAIIAGTGGVAGSVANFAAGEAILAAPWGL